MVAQIIVSVITVLLMIISVIFKPFIKIGKLNIGLYWIICLFGAIILLVFNLVPFDEVIKGITLNTAVNPLKILVLFISMALLSLFLGDSGFFNYIADKTFERAKNGGLKLFLLLYLVVAVLTVFTSNDIIILTFTPCICVFCKKAKVSPIPYLFAEFVGANTWSMALIIGNPTNIYLAGTANISFTSYLSAMWLPAILGGVISLLVLLLLFRKSLTIKQEDAPLYTPTERTYTLNKVLMVASLISLAVCIIMLAISNFIGLEMWLICLISFGALLVFFIIYSIVKDKSIKRVLRVLKGAPYELIPFVLSMFVIVLSLSTSGVTEKIATAIIKNEKIDGVSFGFISALSANLLNNIPMSVLFEKIISAKSIYATYGAIIGSNIGAFITPVGALAGIMWNKILSSYQVKFPFYKFIFYGVIVAIPTILVSTFALFITL